VVLVRATQGDPCGLVGYYVGGKSGGGFGEGGSGIQVRDCCVHEESLEADRRTAIKEITRNGDIKERKGAQGFLVA